MSDAFRATKMLEKLKVQNDDQKVGSNKATISSPCLCVPNIQFSMDAENRRGKFAT